MKTIIPTVLFALLLAMACCGCNRRPETSNDDVPARDAIPRPETSNDDADVPARDAIRENAQLVPKRIKENLGVDLGFDSESVKWLDGYIERNREYLDEPTRAKLVDVFGSYLGEAIIRTYGGEWEEYEGTWCVSFDEKNKAFPFAKVAKQFDNGSEDSIHSFFTVLPLVMKMQHPSGDAEQALPADADKPRR